MIRFNLMLIPWSTRCTTDTDKLLTKRSFLNHYIFGIRVARFHLNR